jgi:hypothetical protein
MGPFGTEREARMAALAAIGPEAVEIIASQPQNLQMLTGACEAAGAELGPFDRRVLDWLSGWESSTCAVVAGLVSRAHDSGRARAGAGVTLTAEQLATVLDALADAGEYRRKEAAQWCADCESSPAAACGEHLDDLDAASAYEALGAELGGAR